MSEYGFVSDVCVCEIKYECNAMSHVDQLLSFMHTLHMRRHEKLKRRAKMRISSFYEEWRMDICINTFGMV